MEKSHILLRLSNANVEAIYAVQEKIKTRVHKNLRIKGKLESNVI